MKTQIVYHGTPSKFDKFEKIKRTDYGYGFYFTPDKLYASDYGRVLTVEIPEDKYFLDLQDSFLYQSEYVQDKLLDILLELDGQDQKTFKEALYNEGFNQGSIIYNTLWDIFKSDEKASECLDKHGIKGLYTLAGNCYIVFNSDSAKIIKSENLVECLNRHIQKYIF